MRAHVRACVRVYLNLVFDISRRVCVDISMCGCVLRAWDGESTGLTEVREGGGGGGNYNRGVCVHEGRCGNVSMY